MKRIAIMGTLLILLCGCFPWEVGKDPRGQRLQAKTEQLIVSIKAYREKYGVLPERIELLVPEFISAAPEHVSFNPHSGLIFFHYQPSWPEAGMSASCSTNIEQVQWHCVGAM